MTSIFVGREHSLPWTPSVGALAKGVASGAESESASWGMAAVNALFLSVHKMFCKYCHYDFLLKSGPQEGSSREVGVESGRRHRKIVLFSLRSRGQVLVIVWI